MKNLYLIKSRTMERVIILVLFILVNPITSWSQTNIYPPGATRSFEYPVVPGSGSSGYIFRPTGGPWTFHGLSGISKNGSYITSANPNAPLGNQVLFIQDDGYIETNYYFNNSGYYRFRFKAAWKDECCGTSKYIRVIVDGVEAGEVEVNSTTYEEYYTLPVYLTSGYNTIRIEGDNPSQVGNYTGLVDDFIIQKLSAIYPFSSTGSVPAGSTYVIGSATYNFNTLDIQGTLVAPQNLDININANYILVTGNGRLQVGQKLAPYTQEAIFTLNGINMSQHGNMGTKFLGAMGNGVIELHGKEKVSWTKLSSTVSSGSNISVVDPVDWEVGDEIVIAPSGRVWDEYEKKTISSISTNGKDITLSTDLSYQHIGATKTYSHRGNPQSWTVDMGAEVGLLTRNIKIQGDAASSNNKIGAHVMIMGNAEAFIEGVELYRMGQSAQLGRYPFHWHERQYAFGQYFKNSSVHLSYNRALTIHRTNYARVENNVFFDHIGHGIFFEEGNEHGNNIIGNLVIGSKKPSPSEAHSQHIEDGETIDKIQNRGPGSFWITHPNNIIEGNVAAGTIGTGFWYIFPASDLGGLGTDPQTAYFGSFKNNVAHSTSNGFDIFDELRYDHSVFSNVGYIRPFDFKILDCTWYSNEVGVYTGAGANRRFTSEFGREIYAPNEHLIFENNIFAENKHSVMQASNNKVQNSIFVANTGLGNPSISNQSLVHMYDGGGIIKDSHIVGYNSNSSHMMSFAGAAVTNGNFRFNNVTKANSVVFNTPTNATTGIGRRNATIYDQDGSISGQAGSTIVVDNSFLLLGGETTPTGWTRSMVSSRRYENTRVLLHLDDAPYYQGFPGVTVKRTKPGTIPESITYGANTSDPILPFIMNEVDLLYTYEFVIGQGQTLQSILPQQHQLIGFQFLNAVQANDFVIIRFTELGVLPGLVVDMGSEDRLYNGQSNLAVTRRYSLNDLKNYPVSAYYIDGNDLYIKAYTNGDYSQNFNIRWDPPIPTRGRAANNFVATEEENQLIDTPLMIYPNPASNKLFINGFKEGEELQIVDFSGKLIQTTTYSKYLNVSTLKSGLYIVRVRGKRFKFIKE